MTQIPANSTDATTGHKLQGMSKDIIVVIMAYWRTSSHVQILGICCPVLCGTLSGLYIIEPIDMDKSLKPLQNSKNTLNMQNEKKQKKKNCDSTIKLAVKEEITTSVH